MWLGEKITDRGIGNGISLLITVGIVATLPLSFTQNLISRISESNGGLIMVVIELAVWLVIILLSILLVMAVRQIPVQYARRNSVPGSQSSGMAKRQYIPLKLNASGVMPIIFAQALMFAPATIGSVFGTSSIGQWLQASFSDIFGLWYNILFGLLVVIFTFFYTAITVPTNKMSDDLKRSGGFVPGIRPGNETSEYLDSVMSHITFPGSLYLAVIAVFPAIVVQLIGMQQGWALFFGGTSLLIMVGVAKVIVIDIHSLIGLKYFSIKTKNETAITDLVKYFKKLSLKDPLIVSPDQGGKNRAKEFANEFNLDYIALEKTRDKKTGTVKIKTKNLKQVENRDLILVDDMISTGGSIIKATQFLKKQKCKKIYVACTHALLMNDAEKKFNYSSKKLYPSHMKRNLDF